MPSVKRYDQRYFDSWYRRRRIASPAALRRMATFAVAITEQVIERPILSVLDVGAGEGRWQPVIARLRPRARYAGVDPSPWAVSHWGRRRNLRLGSIDALDQLGLDGPFDLVIISDVIHYLPTRTLRSGLAQLVPLVGGVAYLPAFTCHNAMEGDRAAFQHRSAAVYRALCVQAGLHSLGMAAWTTAERAARLTALERTS